MKEVEKNEIKRLSDRLDAIRHQQADLSLVEAADKYAELEQEKETLETEIARLRDVHGQKLSKEAQKLAKLPFRRAITKKEQADMGKLKKSVRGLIVVHPMTELGRASRRASSDLPPGNILLPGPSLPLAIGPTNFSQILPAPHISLKCAYNTVANK